jgi:NADPH-dependent glutamate synthase beta subunit-like oxidoreductase
MKSLVRQFERVLGNPRVRFIGNLRVGTDISVSELTHLYDAVIFATGAPDSRPLEIPGEGLAG